MRLVHAAADLVLGTTCVGCGRPGTAACERCASALVPAPQRVDLGALACSAARPYGGVVRDAVVAFKERRVLALRVPLARCLAASVVHVLDGVPGGASGAVCLVPVPSRAAVVRARGHDAVADLAVAAAASLRRVGVDARSARCLAQRRGVRDQVGLDAAGRRDNLAGALRVRRRPPADRLLVVVDDVVTTGASLDAAREALAACGATPLAAVVARAP